MTLSPQAQAVYERLCDGTFEIDLDRLADSLLARMEAGSLEPCVCGGCTGAVPEAIAAEETDSARVSVSRAR